ncbi:MAG: ATP-dependent protease La Type I [Ktedonobacterales bacterium]|jgi:ATP-dependent Lon protease|nr:MAG: ATP-dependent protease La Type I [Ktedonobacterales bacterium]
MEKSTEQIQTEEARQEAATDQTPEAVALREYPLVPLKNTVIFPEAKVTLNIGRDKSILAIREATASDNLFVVSAQRQGDIEQPGPGDVFTVGTLVTIKEHEVQSDNTLQVIVEGVARVAIREWVALEPHLRVSVEPTEVAQDSTEESEKQSAALVRHAHNIFERFAQLSRRFNADDTAAIALVSDPGKLADALAVQVVADYAPQQELLEAADPLVRLEKICVTLGNEIEILELENKIRQRVRQQVDKNQREYYLKEQLRAIQEELGHDQASEVAELREKVAKKNLPEEVAVKVNKELERLERMPAHSAELTVLRNYIDWILALPWQERTEDRLDMKYAHKVLDEDHYGLEKVKERIVEFLAVRQLRMLQAQRAAAEETDDDAKAKAKANVHKGPILCLIGPPGVGKTTLGRSIARSLGRKFVRISLGGVHDEAEIRGHRRTYVGSLPGRIIQAMKTAGVTNPVFLLDEIDKLASDYRGDPAAALLEVLDPDQNSTFTDHYLEVPYDLSEVFFICTGNNRFQIPRPLADRMDIVQIPGYTEEEKIAIGRGHVLGKVLSEHGLAKSQVQIPESAMRYIVNSYTREAGVRGLERQLATICRKAALRIVQKPDARIRVTEKNVEQFLGIPRYLPDRALDRGQVGVATGLAWTEQGGTLLPVEVVTMPGKGGLLVTGQLGEVMQESARAALSYIRSRSHALGISDTFADNLDIHIHLPEGAIPKDGPSGGITMATAIISALTRRPVRSDLAMTGEITLRGRVLAIGGLKEKALAAHRVGIRSLIVPIDNTKDIAEIPAKVRAEMTITQVESMDDVIRIALLEPVPEQMDDDEGSERVNGAGHEPAPPAPSLYPVAEQEVAEGPTDEDVMPPGMSDFVNNHPTAGA